MKWLVPKNLKYFDSVLFICGLHFHKLVHISMNGHGIHFIFATWIIIRLDYHGLSAIYLYGIVLSGA